MVIVAPCFDAKRCACPQPLLYTIPFGQRTRKTPSAYAYTSFISNLVLAKLEAVSKHLRQTFTVCSITNWPHCAWARCHHYETESTISGRNVVLIPGLLPIFLHGCEIKSGCGLGTRLVLSTMQDVLGLDECKLHLSWYCYCKPCCHGNKW